MGFFSREPLPPYERADLNSCIDALDPSDAHDLRNKKHHHGPLSELGPDRVLAVLPAVANNDRGPLVLTERHLTFFGQLHGYIKLPLSDIYDFGLNRVPSLMISYGVKEVDFGVSFTKKASLKFFMDQLEPAVEAARSPASASVSASASTSVADELAKLAELHRQGALTDDEFASMKSSLIAPAAAPDRAEAPTVAETEVASGSQAAHRSGDPVLTPSRTSGECEACGDPLPITEPQSLCQACRMLGPPSVSVGT